MGKKTASASDLPLWHPTRIQVWSCIGFGVLAFFVYLFTLSPTVNGGDSGELIVAAQQLGMPHPPGYPLYTLLAHAFSWLPFHSVAWRINLFSAVTNAGAVVFLALSILYSCRNLALSVLGAGLFAFSPLVWSYATVAEVFSLNNLFAALLLFCAQLCARDLRAKNVYLFSFLCGLALTNHQTILFFAVPLLLWVYLNAVRVRTSGVSVLKILAFGSLGFSVYLYLPIASMHPGLASWGDQSTVDGFLRHLLRSEYGTLKLGDRSSGAGDFFSRLWLYLVHAFKGGLGIGFLFAGFGIFSVYKNKQKPNVLKALAFSYLFYVIVFTALAHIDTEVGVSREILSRFWLQADVCFFFFAAYGLFMFKERIRHGFIVIAALGVALQVGVNFSGQDRSHETVFLDYASGILKSLPANSVFLTQGDHSFGSLRYAQAIENLRPDIIVLDLNYLSYVWSPAWLARNGKGLRIPNPGRYGVHGFHLASLVTANPDHYFFTLGGIPNWDTSLFANFNLWPFGLAEQILVKGKEPEWNAWVAANQQYFESYDWLSLNRYPEEHWAFAVKYEYSEGRTRYGARLAEHGLLPGQDLKWLRMGIDEMEKTALVFPNRRPPAYKNLGIAYMNLAGTDENARKKMIENFEKYLSFGPVDDPAVPTIKETIEKYRRR